MKVRRLTAGSGMETKLTTPQRASLIEPHPGFGVDDTERTIGCPARLSAVRAIARKQKRWTDRACAVLAQGGDRYVVESYEGKIVWAGNAHCPYCARTQAITSQAAQSACARHSSGEISGPCDPRACRICDGRSRHPLDPKNQPSDTPKDNSTAVERCART